MLQSKWIAFKMEMLYYTLKAHLRNVVNLKALLVIMQYIFLFISLYIQMCFLKF